VTEDPRASAQRIGEYFVLHRVGAGAMGTVYAAYDPDLDRKVAVKVLKERASGESIGRKRLQREARALARLQHPNVVTVHAVGEAAGHAWVAMAFVDGVDLATWLGAEKHGWQDVLDVFVGAGRGLAAAHAAGVIHRDFKPGNVLIGKDLQVRVADFGLARPAELASGAGDHAGAGQGVDDLGAARELGETSVADAAPDPGPLGSRPGSGLSTASPSWTAGDDHLTRTRGVVGTPMYMAPEQHVGSRVGASADQYAYCLSLYEALYGEFPFDHTSVISLVEEKHAGAIKAAPASSDVPRWLRRIVVRGLAPEPDDRHPSMDALLAEIDAQRRRAQGRSGRRLALGGVAVAVALAGLGGWYAASNAIPGPAAADPCAEAAADIEARWDQAARSELTTTIEAVEVPFAKTSAEHIMGVLDEHAASLAELRTDTCREEHAGRLATQSARLRRDCLDDARARFDLVLEILATTDRAVLESSSALLSRTLTSPEACRFPSWVVLPDDPDRAEERRAISGDVARFYALNTTGKVEEAQALATTLEARFETVQDGTARGELARMLANRLPPAQPRHFELLHIAYAEALRFRDFALAVFIGIDLAQGHTAMLRHEEALRRIDETVAVWDAMVATAGYEGELPPLVAAMRAQLATLRGDVLKESGSMQAAIDASRAGIERWAAIDGFEGFKVNAYNNLAEVLRQAGEHGEAMALYDQALDLAIGEMGPSSPRVATIYNNRGGAQIELGNYERGVEDLHKGREIQVALDGEKDVNIGLIDYNLATVDLLEGRLEAAEAKLDTAVTVWGATLPPAHPYLAVAHMSRGTLARQRGELDLAVELGGRALDGLLATVGEQHALTATALAELSLTEHAQGHDDAAATRAERSVAAFEASTGLDTPNAAAAFFALAEALRGAAVRDPTSRRRANDAYERAAKILSEHGSPEHPELGWAYLGLAELAVSEGDVDAAHTWITRARAARHGHENPVEFDRRVAAVTEALD